MNVIAFNGSPRKKDWNTVTLLNNALEGAASNNSTTELIHLSELNLSGCRSCFACKKTDRKEDGVCAVQDDLTSILENVRNADALIIGTPVYYGAESALTRALIERLCFPYNKYSKDGKSLFPKQLNTALFYTMNVNDDMLVKYGFNHHFNITKAIFERHFGYCELLLSTNTLQFSDYSKYESEIFDSYEKKKRHNKIFPEDCIRAYELGARIVTS